MERATVKENASTAQSQKEHSGKYKSLNKRYEDAVTALENLKAERTYGSNRQVFITVYSDTEEKSGNF